MEWRTRKAEPEDVNAVRALAYLLRDWRIGASGRVVMSGIRRTVNERRLKLVSRRYDEGHRYIAPRLNNPIRVAQIRGCYSFEATRLR